MHIYMLNIEKSALYQKRVRVSTDLGLICRHISHKSMQQSKERLNHQYVRIMVRYSFSFSTVYLVPPEMSPEIYAVV